MTPPYFYCLPIYIYFALKLFFFPQLSQERIWTTRTIRRQPFAKTVLFLFSITLLCNSLTDNHLSASLTWRRRWRIWNLHVSTSLSQPRMFRRRRYSPDLAGADVAQICSLVADLWVLASGGRRGLTGSCRWRSWIWSVCRFERWLVGGWRRCVVVLEQNVFNITTLSFDDNKQGIKMSIGYTNICSSVQDHRQKLISLKLKYWFWKNKWKQWNLQKKLMLQDRVWRPSEADGHQRVWRASKAEVS